MSKQTAVEWLVDKLMRESTGHISLDALGSYTQQALEIEKEQIEKAFHDSVVAMAVGRIMTPNQYYNEIYNK